MATQKRRLNISLPYDVDKVLVTIAQRDSIPQAAKVVELLERALEIEEDAMWDKIAAERDSKKARFFSHEKAWS